MLTLAVGRPGDGLPDPPRSGISGEGRKQDKVIEKMKIYNMNLSNFASKCRIAIHDKGLNIEIAPIPGNNLKSPEYLKLNPLGKTPALDADGMIIAESEVINEYLEDKFPNPPLLPKTPEGRARVRMLTRFHDLYLEPPLRVGRLLLRERSLGLRAFRRGAGLCRRRLGLLSALFGRRAASARDERREEERRGRNRDAPAVQRVHRA